MIWAKNRWISYICQPLENFLKIIWGSRKNSIVSNIALYGGTLYWGSSVYYEILNIYFCYCPEVDNNSENEPRHWGQMSIQLRHNQAMSFSLCPNHQQKAHGPWHFADMMAMMNLRCRSLIYIENVYCCCDLDRGQTALVIYVWYFSNRCIFSHDKNLSNPN